MTSDAHTPDWLKTRRSVARHVPERSLPLNLSQIVLLALIVPLSILSVSIFLDSPENVVVGVVPTGAVLVALVVVTQREYTLLDKAVYLASAVALNAYYTLEVADAGNMAFFSLASIVLFSGAVGLAMLDSDIRPMPKLQRIVVFLVTLVLFLAANTYTAISPDGDLGLLRIWFEAAYIPISALVVFSVAFVAIYPRGVQTMPADKWV